MLNVLITIYNAFKGLSMVPAWYIAHQTPRALLAIYHAGTMLNPDYNTATSIYLSKND